MITGRRTMFLLCTPFPPTRRDLQSSAGGDRSNGNPIGLDTDLINKNRTKLNVTTYLLSGMPPLSFLTPHQDQVPVLWVPQSALWALSSSSKGLRTTNRSNFIPASVPLGSSISYNDKY